MLGALIIVFREVVEAGLVVGIVLAATRGIAGRGWWVSLGIVVGVLGASIVAAFAGVISNAFAGSGQELLNATVLIIAVVSLTWHNVWMAEHGREIVAELRRVGADVSAGRRPLTALAVVSLPLRDRGGRHLDGFPALRRRAWPARRRRGDSPQLFWPDRDPRPLYLLGDERASRLARGGHGRTGDPLPSSGWCRHRPSFPLVGHVLASVRLEHRRPACSMC